MGAVRTKLALQLNDNSGSFIFLGREELNYLRNKDGRSHAQN